MALTYLGFAVSAAEQSSTTGWKFFYQQHNQYRRHAETNRTAATYHHNVASSAIAQKYGSVLIVLVWAILQCLCIGLCSLKVLGLTEERVAVVLGFQGFLDVDLRNNTRVGFCMTLQPPATKATS